jgi:hypothetical protein
MYMLTGYSCKIERIYKLSHYLENEALYSTDSLG